MVSSCPGLFTLRERAPHINWIGGWVGPRTGLDMVLKKKIPSPHQESNPDHPVIQPIDKGKGKGKFIPVL